jgi:hypothetical protein
MEEAQAVKPVLMIHEVREWMFELPLENYVLTFDDGLYSQFYYYPEFAKIPTQKIYFVSSGVICSGKQSCTFPACSDAHQKAFGGNFEDYMTVHQIKELMKDPLVEIGGHSHSHTRIQHPRLTDRIAHVMKDTTTMLEWFNTNLGLKPSSFCFPYNDSVQGMYPALLKRYGFARFYGNERTPIESLLLDIKN